MENAFTKSIDETIKELISNLEWMLDDIEQNQSYQSKYYPDIIKQSIFYLKKIKSEEKQNGQE